MDETTYIDESTQSKKKSKSSWGSIILWLFVLTGAVLAFWYSWSCNSNVNSEMNAFIRGLRALIAAFWGWFYLGVYAIFWAGEPCRKKSLY